MRGRYVSDDVAQTSGHPRTPPLNVSTRKIDRIKLKSSYLRLDTDVSTLKKSVGSIGLIHPVTVNQDDELIAGARRFQAAKELGWEEIPVQVVEQDALVQELVSIDENLVREPLGQLDLERSLNRGREIYESLNPAAKEAVKRARGQGELNATKTNEIIRLAKEAQEEILPLVAGKTAKETRQIVSAALEGGMEAAKEESDKVVPLPREYGQMLSPLKRMNRSLSRILAEELLYEGPEQARINNALVSLRNNLSLYLRMAGLEE